MTGCHLIITLGLFALLLFSFQGTQFVIAETTTFINLTRFNMFRQQLFFGQFHII